MGHIVDTVYVHAPVEQVWTFLTDYGRYPEWQTNLIETKDFIGTPGEVGFAYTFVYKALGRRLEGRFEVVQSERPRMLVEKGHMPGAGEARSTTEIQSTPDGETKVTFTMDYELGSSFLAGLADKFVFERSIERDIRHSGENLKALIEAEVRVPVHA